jgi:hypothetical protein
LLLGAAAPVHAHLPCSITSSMSRQPRDSRNWADWWATCASEIRTACRKSTDLRKHIPRPHFVCCSVASVLVQPALRPNSWEFGRCGSRRAPRISPNSHGFGYSQLRSRGLTLGMPQGRDLRGSGLRSSRPVGARRS